MCQAIYYIFYSLDKLFKARTLICFIYVLMHTNHLKTQSLVISHSSEGWFGNSAGLVGVTQVGAAPDRLAGTGGPKIVSFTCTKIVLAVSCGSSVSLYVAPLLQ